MTIDDTIDILANIINEFIDTWDCKGLLYSLCKFDRLIHILAGDLNNRCKWSTVAQKLGLKRTDWVFRILGIGINYRGRIVHFLSVKSNDIFDIDDISLCISETIVTLQEVQYELNLIKDKEMSYSYFGDILVEKYNDKIIAYSTNGNYLEIRRGLK